MLILTKISTDMIVIKRKNLLKREWVRNYLTYYDL